MRWARRLAVLLVMLIGSDVEYASAESAEDATPDKTLTVHTVHCRTFGIPFKCHADPGFEVESINLFVSRDEGKAWKLDQRAEPSKRRFRFTANQDGLYWFAVQVITKESEAFPPTPDELSPSLKVRVQVERPGRNSLNLVMKHS